MQYKVLEQNVNMDLVAISHRLERHATYVSSQVRISSDLISACVSVKSVLHHIQHNDTQYLSYHI
jgi:hypothetical protein